MVRRSVESKVSDDRWAGFVCASSAHQVEDSALPQESQRGGEPVSRVTRTTGVQCLLLSQRQRTESVEHRQRFPVIHEGVDSIVIEREREVLVGAPSHDAIVAASKARCAGLEDEAFHLLGCNRGNGEGQPRSLRVAEQHGPLATQDA